MIPALDLPTILWDFVIINLSFTLGLVLLRADRIWDGASLWIAGNMAILASIAIRLGAYKHPGLVMMSLAPQTLVMTASLLKLLSLSRKRQRPTVAMVGGGLLLAYLIVTWTLGGVPRFNFAIGGATSILTLFLAWQCIVCFRDPRWRGLRGGYLLIATNGLAATYAITVAVRGFDMPQGYAIFHQSSMAQTNLAVSMIYLVITHICLIAMLMAKLNRIVAAGRIREDRQIKLAQQAATHAAEMAAIAQEKQSLLEVLIHEVRQPLNNAQAALQDVMMTLRVKSRDHGAGGRLQAIIDQIVLSLSNAIVGASVLERQRQSSLVTTDIASICQLACSDVGPDWKDRIELVQIEPGIFAQADPILLRLAVRNLIDNALKHSAADARVGVTIGADDASMTVRIAVTNTPNAPFTPTDDLFGRGIRGANASSQGSGLGLYIVREIALLHQGRVEARTTANGLTQFELTIPA